MSYLLRPHLTSLPITGKLFLNGIRVIFDQVHFKMHRDSSPPLFGTFGVRRKSTSGGCNDEGSDRGRVVAHRDVPTARQRRETSPGWKFVQVAGLPWEQQEIATAERHGDWCVDRWTSVVAAGQS